MSQSYEQQRTASTHTPTAAPPAARSGPHPVVRARPGAVVPVCRLQGARAARVEGGLLDARLDHVERHDGDVTRILEAAQGAYVGLSAAHHLLIKGGPLPVILVQRMAGDLWFDTLYECVLPLVKGTPLSIPFLAHHLVGLAAHGLAKTHGPLRAVTAHVYLAELSTPQSLRCASMRSPYDGTI